MDKYSRDDRSDLSGMNPSQLQSYLQPKYEEGLWEGIKWPAIIVLSVGGTIACIVAFFWLLLT